MKKNKIKFLDISLLILSILVYGFPFYLTISSFLQIDSRMESKTIVQFILVGISFFILFLTCVLMFVFLKKHISNKLFLVLMIIFSVLVISSLFYTCYIETTSIFTTLGLAKEVPSSIVNHYKNIYISNLVNCFVLFGLNLYFLIRNYFTYLKNN